MFLSGGLVASMMLFVTSFAVAAPIISGKYYEDFATAQCSNANSCTLTFTAIPDGKSVLFNRVSCYFALPGFNAAVRGVLQVKGANGVLVPRREEEIPLSAFGGGGSTHESSNSEIETKLTQKLVPIITFTFSAVVDANPHCRLVGQIPSPI